MVMYTFEFKYQILPYYPPDLALERTVYPRRRKGDKPERKRRYTAVTVFCDGDIIAKGESLQHPHDQDVKEIARKMALRHALLSHVALTKEARTAIWAAYFARKTE